MKTLFKFAVAATLTGALALAATTPSEARGGRNAAAGIGFAAGALLGAAAASSARNGYYADDGYYYGEPGYAYGSNYYEGYAYEPAPVYSGPRYRYRYRSGNANCPPDLGSARPGCN